MKLNVIALFVVLITGIAVGCSGGPSNAQLPGATTDTPESANSTATPRAEATQNVPGQAATNSEGILNSNGREGLQSTMRIVENILNGRRAVDPDPESVRAGGPNTVTRNDIKTADLGSGDMWAVATHTLDGVDRKHAVVLYADGTVEFLPNVAPGDVNGSPEQKVSMSDLINAISAFGAEVAASSQTPAATPTPVAAQEQKIFYVVAETIDAGPTIDLTELTILASRGALPGEVGSPNIANIIVSDYMIDTKKSFTIPQDARLVNEGTGNPIEFDVGGYRILLVRATDIEVPVTYGEVAIIQARIESQTQQSQSAQEDPIQAATPAPRATPTPVPVATTNNVFFDFSPTQDSDAYSHRISGGDIKKYLDAHPGVTEIGVSSDPRHVQGNPVAEQFMVELRPGDNIYGGEPYDNSGANLFFTLLEGDKGKIGVDATLFVLDGNTGKLWGVSDTARAAINNETVQPHILEAGTPILGTFSSVLNTGTRRTGVAPGAKGVSDLVVNQDPSLENVRETEVA